MDIEIFTHTSKNLAEVIMDESSAITQISVKIENDYKKFSIEKVFEFESSLQRMSVIAKATDGTVTSFVKGSPEMIKSLSTTDSIPHWLDSDLMMHTQKGFRVIAYATKTFKSSDGITREQAESQLTFLGLLWMENQIKEATTGVITNLKANNLQVMMATGDNILTAISVAQECKIIPQGMPVFYAQRDDESNELVWNQMISHAKMDKEREIESLTEGIKINQVTNLKCDGDFSQFPFNDKNPGEFAIALTGPAFDEVVIKFDPATRARLLDQCAVFARMTPIMKAKLVSII